MYISNRFKITLSALIVAVCGGVIVFSLQRAGSKVNKDRPSMDEIPPPMEVAMARPQELIIAVADPVI